ncbi:homeobox protein 5-like isoform X2 [Panonychus citri]|uniref:homeobox protein 5-like isoform X2 n=1 Tax=Panonychus citri TaxID=50023 RepID=UPI00230784A3|nr:homeobox protein 5-like isoform X2 [Panonychus citri]
MVKLKVFHSSFFILFSLFSSIIISFCLSTDLSPTSSVTLSTLTSPVNNVTTSTTFTCPEQFGYYIDHSDCTKYFVCVFGEALHETCTGGLYFSSELQTCDWPRNVLCGIGNKTEKVTHASTGLDKGSSSLSIDNNKNHDKLTDKEITYDTNLDGNNNGNDGLISPPITLPDIDSISSGNNNHANDGSSSSSLSSSSSDKDNRKDKEAEDLDLQRSRTTLNKNFVSNSGNTNFNYLDFTNNVNGRNPSSSSSFTGLTSNRRDNSTINGNNIHLDVEPPSGSNYEETSSTVVDSNGGIHLPDGQGGLFGINGQLPGLLTTGNDQGKHVDSSSSSGKEVRSIDESRLPGEHRTGRSSDDIIGVDRRRGVPHYQLQALRQAQHFRRMSPVIPIILPKPGSSDSSSSSASPSVGSSSSSSSPTALNSETKRQDYDYDSYQSDPIQQPPLIHGGGGGGPDSGLTPRSSLSPDSGRTRSAVRGGSGSSGSARGVSHFGEPSFVEYIDDRPGEGYYEEEKVVVDHYNQARGRQSQPSLSPPRSSSTPTLPLPPPNRGDSSSGRSRYSPVPRVNSQPHFRPFVPPYAGFEERAPPQSQHQPPPPQPIVSPPSSGSHRHQRPSSSDVLIGERNRGNEEINNRPLTPSTWEPYPRSPESTPHHGDHHDSYDRPEDEPHQPTRYISHEPPAVTEPTRTTEPLIYQQPPSNSPSIKPVSNRKPGSSGLQQPSSSPYHQPGLSVSRNRPRTQSFGNNGEAPIKPQIQSPSSTSPPPPPPLPSTPPQPSINTNRNRPNPQQDAAPRLPTGSGVPSEHGQPFGLVDYDDELPSDQRFPVSGPIIDQPSPPQTSPPVPPPRTRSPTTTTTTPTTAVAIVEHKPPTNRQRGNYTPINSPSSSSSGQSSRSSSSSSSGSSSNTNTNNNDQGSNRRRPRPTNKRLTVRPKATGPPTFPARPVNLYPTVEPATPAGKCDPRVCRLPDCNCGSSSIPGGLKSSQVPQIVMITFDDAINDLNWEIYEEIFNSNRRNPNGCPLLGTFYVSHEWTDYGQVQTLYSRGHEMASHGITHSFGEKFSTSQWHKEIHGQREVLYLYGGVKMEDVRGMRAPFLQIGGNKMFQMLYNDNFTYDSSMPVFDNKPPFWPYTLDYSVNHECMIAPCPTESFPGVWEVDDKQFKTILVIEKEKKLFHSFLI